jgi:hypothetical protein
VPVSISPVRECTKPSLSDELDPDDKETRRTNLAAAGVKPRASGRFINGVKSQLVKKRNYAMQARQLNKIGVADANGQPWTKSSIRAFHQTFLPHLN